MDELFDLHTAHETHKTPHTQKKNNYASDPHFAWGHVLQDWAFLPALITKINITHLVLPYKNWIPTQSCSRWAFSKLSINLKKHHSLQPHFGKGIDVTLFSLPFMWNRSHRWELQAFWPGSLPSIDKIRSHRTINECLRLYLILPEMLRHYIYETWVTILWPVWRKSLTYFHGWLGTNFQIRLIWPIGMFSPYLPLYCNKVEFPTITLVL